MCPYGHAWTPGTKTQTTGHYANKYRYKCGECSVFFTQIRFNIMEQEGKSITQRDAKIVKKARSTNDITINTIRDDTKKHANKKNVYETKSFASTAATAYEWRGKERHTLLVDIFPISHSLVGIPYFIPYFTFPLYYLTTF